MKAYLAALLDLAACMLPCMLFLAIVDYVAWANWWDR
jgi:hypothetical protein